MLNLVYFACCVSPMNKCTHYLSSLCILVSTRCSCTFSPQIEADFSSWGGFKTDGKPSKGSSHLSPTNIPMMANYPSYHQHYQREPVQMCGGRGTCSPALWCCCVCFQISAFTVLCASNSDASHRNPMEFKEKCIIQVTFSEALVPVCMYFSGGGKVQYIKRG